MLLCFDAKINNVVRGITIELDPLPRSRPRGELAEEYEQEVNAMWEDVKEIYAVIPHGKTYAYIGERESKPQAYMTIDGGVIVWKQAQKPLKKAGRRNKQ